MRRGQAWEGGIQTRTTAVLLSLCLYSSGASAIEFKDVPTILPGNASKLAHTFMRGEHQFDGWEQSSAASAYDRYEIVVYRSIQEGDLLVLTRHPLPLLERFREDYLVMDALRIRPSSSNQAIVTTCLETRAQKMAVFALVDDPLGAPTPVAAWKVELETGRMERYSDPRAVTCIADTGEGE